jgi:hypothetical protein
MPAAPADNPCKWKRPCVSCTKALMSDRPTLCRSMECEHYTPCKQCKNNRILDGNGLCNVCVAEARSPKKKAEGSRPIVQLGSDGQLEETTADLQTALDNDEIDESQARTRRLSISPPGIPPAEYSESEKEIYNGKWAEYQGFYRDPTAKSIIHSIITIEIELSWVINEMIHVRGNPDKGLEQQRSRLIRNLSELHGQLPKKEAIDESDDEKFLSMVYEKYTEELSQRKLGRVSRLLTPEAIALAPVLVFPIDPQELLTDLGYKTVDAAQACSHILLDDLPKQPEKVLEFFGFFLQEKYALPITDMVVEDEEEPLPAVANPAELSLSTDDLDDES